jgi:hypothetical protein
LIRVCYRISLERRCLLLTPDRATTCSPRPGRRSGSAAWSRRLTFSKSWVRPIAGVYDSILQFAVVSISVVHGGAYIADAFGVFGIHMIQKIQPSRRSRVRVGDRGETDDKSENCESTRVGKHDKSPPMGCLIAARSYHASMLPSRACATSHGKLIGAVVMRSLADANVQFAIRYSINRECNLSGELRIAAKPSRV